MSLVKSADTKPELRIRKMLHRLGYRYRLHVKDLPGCPDLVFTSRGKVIFVHGCFWHRHKGCARCRLPKTKLDFWITKLENNAKRDKKNLSKLKRMGWKVLVIWECETENENKAMSKAVKFLEGR